MQVLAQFASEYPFTSFALAGVLARGEEYRMHQGDSRSPGIRVPDRVGPDLDDALAKALGDRRREHADDFGLLGFADSDPQGQT
jgi:hypothetical protein